MDALLQTQLLINDRRSVTVARGSVLTALRRGQEHLAHEEQAVEQRSMLTIAAGVARVTLPVDHVQTYALARGLLNGGLRLVDSDAEPWWLRVDSTGTLSFQNTDPGGTSHFATSTRVALRLLDSDGFEWYLYPSTTGDLVVDTVAPTGTVEQRTVQLRDELGNPWYLSVDTTGTVSSSRRGAAVLKIPAVELAPLTLVEPEALYEIDPAQTGGPPRYYAIEGKSLWVSPVPTVTAAYEHLYYTATVTALPQAYESAASRYAAAYLLMGQQQGRTANLPSETLMAVYELYATLLRQRLNNAQADALEAAQEPRR